ncbi:MAG: molybdopterin-dependent oxidoreductase, partial [Candidatus Heimdallarchaeota archaeon]|nr:molybdopterin-dependent oxidoreductase [Candidatus Heimdallarchaeota archaeon]
MGKKKLGKIEKLALKFKLLPHLEEEIGPKAEKASENELTAYPPFEMWDNWVEFDSKKWPAQKVSKEYNIIPSTCFNCESACGITCLVEKETNEIVKVQGNPLHPASRGRNCAKGPATINQINDPHRIMHPLKRDGPRGSGKWKQVTWKEVIEDVSARIRKAIIENRQNEVMYHIGRPG